MNLRECVGENEERRLVAVCNYMDELRIDTLINLWAIALIEYASE